MKVFKWLDAYKEGNLRTLLFSETKSLDEIPTSQDFIQAFNSNVIDSNDLDTACDLLNEIAHLLHDHAEELELIKRQRAREMKPKKMHLITKPQKK